MCLSALPCHSACENQTTSDSFLMVFVSGGITVCGDVMPCSLADVF